MCAYMRCVLYRGEIRAARAAVTLVAAAGVGGVRGAEQSASSRVRVTLRDLTGVCRSRACGFGRPRARRNRAHLRTWLTCAESRLSQGVDRCRL